MKVKDNKGSITIFVIVGLLFMTMYLIISYGVNVNKSKLAKEQFDIISEIYSHGDGDTNAYNRAYEALRNKNKKVITKTVTSTYVTLTQTFEEVLSNYQIYGGTTALGEYDSTKGKYRIQIEVIGNNNKSEIYNIYLSSQLKLNEYISYSNQGVLMGDGSLKESVTLPAISAYEDYTKIEIISGGTPSKIVVNYRGYTL